MTHEEIKEKSFKLEWKVSDCHSGPDCWCKVIKLKEPLFDDEGYEYEVIRDASVNDEMAQHIVKLHNESL